MIKTFFVNPGHLVQCGDLWYEPGILLVVEPDEQVKIFADDDGMPGVVVGCHDFPHLDETAPPVGLLNAGSFSSGPADYQPPMLAAA
jgi:hypothetical protein